MSKCPWSFWVVSGVALVYNAAGVVNFISQMSADSMAALPELYRTIIEQRPIWATGAFAVAVFGGTLGCLLLLLRKSLAYPTFIVSLAGTVVTLVHTLWATLLVDAPAGFVVGNLVQLLITALLIWYAKRAETRGWIGQWL